MHEQGYGLPSGRYLVSTLAEEVTYCLRPRGPKQIDDLCESTLRLKKAAEMHGDATLQADIERIVTLAFEAEAAMNAHLCDCVQISAIAATVVLESIRSDPLLRHENTVATAAKTVKAMLPFWKGQ